MRRGSSGRSRGWGGEVADGDLHIPAGFPRARIPSLRARTAAAVAGVKAGGESVRAVDIRPDGSIRVFTGDHVPSADVTGDEPNEWDEVLAP